MIGELQQENNELKEQIKEIGKQRTDFIKLHNKDIDKLKAYRNNLLRLMNNETDIKQLRQAYNNLKAIQKINGHLNINELSKFKNQLNNEPIFNLCCLLLNEY